MYIKFIFQIIKRETTASRDQQPWTLVVQVRRFAHKVRKIHCLYWKEEHEVSRIPTHGPFRAQGPCRNQ